MASVLLGTTFLPSSTSGQAKLVVPQKESNGGAAGGSYAPQFSGDGRTLLFLSHARNLATDDGGGGGLNVYVMNLTNRQVKMVSRPSGGSFANGSSGMATISSNGQHVVFESMAGNFVGGDTNASKDVFVRNLQNGTTALISVNTNGIGPGQIDSFKPVMTPDGRWVAFESWARNLAPIDESSVLNVFLRDQLSGKTVAVSRGSTNAGANSYSPAITPDGVKVAFVSTARFGIGGVQNSLGDVYIRHMESGAIYPASTNVPLPRRCFFPQISDDGGRVLFKVFHNYQWKTQVCLFDQVSGSTTIISTNANDQTVPVLSGDGRLVVSENAGNVYLWDLLAGTNLLVSVEMSGTGPGNAASYGPVVSRDLTRVAFVSEATNLTANVGNGKPHIYVRDLVQGVTRLVTADTNGAASGDFTGVAPVISPDGNLVAFDSSASNLVPDDINEASDIFLYSWASNAVQLVSQPAPGKSNRTARRPSFSGGASVSRDGRYVAFNTMDKSFYSFAITNPFCFVVWDTWQERNIVTNLIVQPPAGAGMAFLPPVIGPRPPALSGDGSTLAYVVQTYDFIANPGIGSLYRLDLTSGEQRLVGQSRNLSSNTVTHLNPSMSDDGRYVVFQGDATSLSGSIPDTNGQTDVFLFDAVAGTASLVSVSAGGSAVGSGGSSNAVITPDGKWIFFTSMSSNLCSNLPASFTATNVLLYARDRMKGETYALGSPQMPYVRPGRPVVDASNRVVFFEEWIPGRKIALHGYDLVTLSNVFYKNEAFNPAVSADGRFLAYTKGIFTSRSRADVFLYDFERHMESLITPRTGSPTVWTEVSADLSISPNGRYVTFSSTAGNLVTGDANFAPDVFVHDRVLGVTTLLSVNQEGTGAGAAASLQPVMSGDGKTVVFQSFAGDLVEGDYNHSCDVFVARLGTPDSDNDGLDDDWEVAYFGNLSRSGSEDFDGDGQTDRQEFSAGTDPKNDGSILRVVTVSRMNFGVVTILWNAVPGRGYRVQYKDDLSTNSWTELRQGVVATSAIASLQDTEPKPRRFYRVVVGGE